MKISLNFLENWSLAKTIIISFLILLTLGLGFYVLVLNIYLQELNELGIENETAQNRLIRERELFSKRTSLKANLEILKRFETLAKTQLPENRDIPMILSNIESLSKEIGIKVYSFIPQRELIKESYAEIPVELSFDGTFEQIQVFVDELSRFTRIINVTDLELSDPIGYALYGRVGVRGKMLISAFRQLTEQERLAKEEEKKDAKPVKKGHESEGGLISREY